MRWDRMRLFNTPPECCLVRAVLPEAPPFAAATWYGEDSNPVRFDLYANARPGHDEFPIAIFELVDGVMVRRAPEERVKRVRAAAGAAPIPQPRTESVQKTMVYKEAA